MAYDEALLDRGQKKKPLDKKRVVWTLVTMVMTFLIYASYHMTRKIPSVVTNVIHPVDSNKASVYNVTVSTDGQNCSNTGWEPFNDDLNPKYINQANVGVIVSDCSINAVNGHYEAAQVVAYSSYHQSTTGTPVLHYCASVVLNGCSNYTKNTLFSGWVIANGTGDPCADANVLFAAKTASPVPNAVGIDPKTTKSLWTSCQARQDEIHFSISTNGVASGTILWGDMITMYLAFYALGLFVSGHVADRMNLKLFVSIGMFGSAATVVLVGLGYYFNITTSYYYWIVFAVQGLFQSTGWPAVVAITGPWLGKGKRGLAMGIWNAHTSVGNIMGNVIGAAGLVVVSPDFDCENNWPMAFILAGIVMTGVNFLSIIILKSSPESVGLEEAEVEGESEKMGLPVDDSYVGEKEQKKRPTFIRALCVPGLVEFAVCLFFCKLVAYTFIYWGPTYVAHGGLDAVDATKYSSFLDYGGIIGGIGAGFLADRIKSQAWVAFSCLVLGIVALYIFRVFTANIAEDQLLEYKLLMMMVGIFINAPYALITTAVSADLGTTTKGDDDLMATVTGIIDGTGSIGAAIQGALIGYISTKYGWNTVFYLLMGFLAVSALMLSRLVIRDSRRLCCNNRRQLQGE